MDEAGFSEQKTNLCTFKIYTHFKFYLFNRVN